MKNQTFYVLALFDEKTNQIFTELTENLKKNNIDFLEELPHITLGGYTEVPESEITSWVKEFSETHCPLKINFNHIGLFPQSICFIGSKVNEELLRFHREFHANFDSCFTEIGYNFTLCSENWVPHMTIITGNAENIFKGIPILFSAFQPFIGTITELAIYQFDPFLELRRFPLKHTDFQTDKKR
ncbi:MAG TPA: 2'-5' RNA ligase family protein [Flexilinea sp.]|jgi:2'-5' RNA ligase|nr:2'-5' RNA ligase family protein [Flexilinea sp.]HOG60341.1 2'-5' RNA ligase family protein [Flexilinea sp.]HOP00604.1 2'-5' RNA ligase family protein [Flexilinea sp.]HOU19815.1 2'-5' RNA ligase family protein [Flexilinea sp.]HPJ64622.1 2'-5' RNA ligase family protein [Flexilinea sp.]